MLNMDALNNSYDRMYDAFGLIASGPRLESSPDWKTLIFSERAVPITPNARYPKRMVSVAGLKLKGARGSHRTPSHPLPDPGHPLRTH